VCSMAFKSQEKDYDLFEMAAIHRELLLDPDVVEMRSIKDHIECVKVEKKLICPIGQKEIVDAYFGDCGHAIEKKEALKYLKGNSKFVCPHAGCNKRFMSSKRS
jgi:SUMO ligase MMS21 Smc5/6 complex component